MKPITETRGTRWRVSRLTSGGEERYPESIDVGGQVGPVVRYEPTYTARRLRTGFSGHVRCSQCDAFNPKDNNYCRRCGARFEGED